MKKVLRIGFVIILFFFLYGFGSIGIKSEEVDKLSEAVKQFAYEDSYAFDSELIADWKNEDNIMLLDEMQKKRTLEVDFIRANLALSDGDYASADTLFQKCLDKADSEKYTDLYAKCLYERARSLAADNQLDEANKLIDSMQEIYEDKSDRELNIKLNTFWAFELLGYNEGSSLSVKLMLKTRELAIEYNYSDLEYVLYMLATAYAYDGNIKEANKYYYEALNRAKEKNDKYWIASINIEIGINYNTTEKYEKSLEYFNSALQVLDDPSIDQYEALLKKVYLYNQCALSYMGIGDSNKAKELLDKGRELIQQEKEGRKKLDDFATYYCSLGIYHSNMEDYKEAIKCFDKATEYYGDGANSFYSGFDSYLLQCYGNVYDKMGKYSKALEYYLKTEEIYLASGNEFFDIECINKIYELYCKMGNYQKAVKYADRRIEYLQKKNELQEEKNEDYLLEQLNANEREAELERLKERNEYLDIINIAVTSVIVLTILFALNMNKKNKKIKKLNEQLERLSNIDSLTGLNNRRALEGYLDDNWDKIIKNNLPVSMVMIDIDYFKKYNDYYGHQAGDKVISSIADEIKSMCRQEDFAVRYGGEEFLIILPNTAIDEATKLLEQLQARIKNKNIEHIKSEVAECVTISIGCACAQDSVQHLKLISGADQLLYKAKKKRNCIETVELERK